MPYLFSPQRLVFMYSWRRSRSPYRGFFACKGMNATSIVPASCSATSALWASRLSMRYSLSMVCSTSDYYQFLQWTVGVTLTTPIEGGAPPLRTRLLKMVNPSTVGILLAVIGVFAGVRIPEPVNSALLAVGDVTTPLAMIYLGALFSGLNLSASLKRKEFYGSILCKMCLFPLLFYQLLHLWQLPEDMIITLCLLSAMPTMTALAMLAKTQRSAGDYAAAMIFAATLSSIVTLPLVCLFLRT